MLASEQIDNTFSDLYLRCPVLAYNYLRENITIVVDYEQAKLVAIAIKELKLQDGLPF